MELKLNTVTLTVASLAMLLVVNSAMAFIAEDEYLGEEYDEAQSECRRKKMFEIWMRSGISWSLYFFANSYLLRRPGV